MSHMSYTRPANRSGPGNTHTQILREPTRAEYIALTLMEERQARVSTPRPVTLRKFSFE